MMRRLSRRFRSTGFVSRRGWIIRRFTRDRRGVVAVMFAMSALLLAVAVGSGIDLQRAYMARQQLSAVATLTCQYSNRPIVARLAYGSGGSAAYVAKVNSFYGSAMTAQNVFWTQTTSAPFSYTMGGAGNVTLAASIPATIMHVLAISSIPVSVSIRCFTNIATVAQPVPDSTATLLVNEGFENSAYPSSIAWYLPTGNFEPYGATTYAVPVTNTVPTTVGYVGSNGNVWLVMGYCLETDHVGKVAATVPQGIQSGELDCDNGSDTAGNSSISTKIYLTAGSYELRWEYAGRVGNEYYDTSYICGTTAAELSWANDTSYMYGSTPLGARTDQINVYLDQTSSGMPPTHTTIDTTQTLAGSNLIDECVYSSGWIERSVPINVSAAGYYWLSLAADGANDSVGGDIDNIRLCKGTCSGTFRHRGCRPTMAETTLCCSRIRSKARRIPDHRMTIAALSATVMVRRRFGVSMVKAGARRRTTLRRTGRASVRKAASASKLAGLML